MAKVEHKLDNRAPKKCIGGSLVNEGESQFPSMAY